MRQPLHKIGHEFTNLGIFMPKCPLLKILLQANDNINNGDGIRCRENGSKRKTAQYFHSLIWLLTISNACWMPICQWLFTVHAHSDYYSTDAVYCRQLAACVMSLSVNCHGSQGSDRSHPQSWSPVSVISQSTDISMFS